MNSADYLKRIGIADADVKPNLDGLYRLHRAHLLTVPFENLDIHWNKPITINIEEHYRKIVGQNRGGFCYELNGAFHWLLNALGFDAWMVSARVTRGDGMFGPEYDHMAIVVNIDGDEYVADVGFGDFVAGPLKLEIGTEQQDANGTFRFAQFDDEYFLVQKKSGDKWDDDYVFTTTARELSEYAEMCFYQQTSPESHFTQNRICSLMTETGRKTLSSNKFIVTTNGEKTETPIASPQEFNEILKREFNINAPN